ncbi:MAG: aldehyde dehydrogenase family protein [Acidobacteria bacterium]|nr:aldehyde dehydrogenase family protein [Acidobacteriota bacterium]MBI3473174.1 aldehyde dehydrogenase family protein [Candidatus Solibacter usitatus]
MLHDKDLVSIQEVRSKTEKAWAASRKYRAYTQEQVDAIVERMAAAARAHSERLAEMAAAETGYGNGKDKHAKNLLCADLLPRRMRGLKTVGVLREIPEERVIEIGVPVGVVAAILPTTNPTSTAIYKSLISLKAGNAVVLSPHPNARQCTCETAGILYGAAVEAGAPEDILQCITNPTLEGTNALMRHERTGVILSTGGHGIVKAAYSSGKPAFGVGPGNVPVLIESSADIAGAVAKVVEGKSFDYGTVCSSEQAIVAESGLRDAIVAELKARKAYFCSPAEREALGKLLLTPNWTVNPKCVGQPPDKIASMAGFQVPSGTSILVAEIEGIGKQHPLSAEKLSPVLALYFVADFAAALDACEAILRFGGLGHTCVIYSKDDARIREFGMRMPAFRILVNTPAPQGSTGITTNVFPSMTLGCGAMAGNITSDNIGPLHLINIKRIAYAVRSAEEAFEVPVTGAAGAATADRRTVGAAVERYLAQRGIAVSPAAPAAASPAPTPSCGCSDRAPAPFAAAQVVDRFLAARRTPSPAASAGPDPARIPPPPPVVDFVCESDVRAAIQAAKKIYIGRKTIVTPAARELADRHDILVST